MSGPSATLVSHSSVFPTDSSALNCSPSASLMMAWAIQKRGEPSQHPASSVSISSSQITKLNFVKDVPKGRPFFSITLSTFLLLGYSTGSGMSSFFEKIPPLMLTNERSSSSWNFIRTQASGPPIPLARDKTTEPAEAFEPSTASFPTVGSTSKMILPVLLATSSHVCASTDTTQSKTTAQQYNTREFISWHYSLVERTQCSDEFRLS
mmetsp:Transcript_11626/g.16815  ORF Transcript_11626/g.16815 Transcript_11626/m.16815 type:complete len:208 (-) Transcript_11626:99-722(-)